MGFFGRRESLRLSVCLSVCLVQFCLPNARLPENDPTITRTALSSQVVPLESNLTIVAPLLTFKPLSPISNFFPLNEIRMAVCHD